MDELKDRDEDLVGSAHGVNIQRSGSGSSSVKTTDSNWSRLMMGATFLSLNPWDWYLSCRKEKIVTVEPVLFLYMFGNFLFANLIPQYYFNRYALERVGANDAARLENGTSCINITEVDVYTGYNDTDTVVESHTTLLIVYCSIAYQPLSFFSTLFLGPLSDYFGRRMVLIVVLLGAALQAVCAIFIVHFNLSLYLFILAYAIVGVTGGLSSIVMACYSYISDVSSKKWRTVRLGVVDSMIFLAGIISSAFGGWWFKHLHCRLLYPLIFVIACNVAAIIYVLVFLPASVSRDQRKSMNRSKMTEGFEILMQGLKILFGKVKKYRPVAWIIWVAFIPMIVITINAFGSAAVQILFLKYLHWGPEWIGAQVASTLASRFVVLAFILPLLVAVKLPDPLISLVGAVFNLTMNLFMGLSHKTYQVFIVAIVKGMDGVVFPPLRSLLSRLVAPEDQGALFSLLASSEVIGTLIGEVAFPLILPLSLKHHLNPGMAYVVMAAVGLVPIPFLCVLLAVWCKGKFRSVVPSGNVWERQTLKTVPDNSESSALLSGYDDGPSIKIKPKEH